MFANKMKMKMKCVVQYAAIVHSMNKRTRIRIAHILIVRVSTGNNFVFMRFMAAVEIATLNKIQQRKIQR